MNSDKSKGELHISTENFVPKHINAKRAIRYINVPLKNTNFQLSILVRLVEVNAAVIVGTINPAMALKPFTKPVTVPQ